MFAHKAYSFKMEYASQRLLVIQDSRGMELNAHQFHVHQVLHMSILVNAVKRQFIIARLVLFGMVYNVQLSLIFAPTV